MFYKTLEHSGCFAPKYGLNFEPDLLSPISFSSEKKSSPVSDFGFVELVVVFLVDTICILCIRKGNTWAGGVDRYLVMSMRFLTSRSVGSG